MTMSKQLKVIKHHYIIQMLTLNYCTELVTVTTLLPGLPGLPGHTTDTRPMEQDNSTIILLF